MRSPPSRVDGEKTFTTQRALPKPLKFIFGILNNMGDEKTLEFHEFFHLYVVLSEIAVNRNLSSTKSLEKSFEKMMKNRRKPESNMPYFIWAFMNPPREYLLSKKVVRDIIK